MSARGPISGFPEWLPEEEVIQSEVLATLRREFELHGFGPLHLRSVEPLNVLLAKGGDADKEIYGVQRLSAEPEAKTKLGLHFDLTVPMTRYVMQNRGKLVFPFRRYQIAPCWRGERPQLGRYREFLQADIDIIGDGKLDPIYDAEMIWLLARLMDKLPIPRVRLFVNNRKLLEGLYRGFGVEDISETLRIVDKIDKIGREETCRLLVDAGLTAGAAEKCVAVADVEATDRSVVDAVEALGVSNELVSEGLKELTDVLEYGRGSNVVAALRIARGLNYYTGTVVEGVLEGYESSGSVCSGGRYDDLAGDNKVKLPGMGVSIGVTRLMGLCLHHGLLKPGSRSPASVLVVVHKPEEITSSHEVAGALRERGVKTVVSHRASAYGKQIQWAEKMGIRYVWFPARADSPHEVRDIVEGQQAAADLSTWSPAV